jgi:hypothetical protein
MSRFNSERQAEIFDNNKKVRYRMFKAGKQWLVAGTATVSGAAGGMLLGGTGAFADSTDPKAIQADDQSVLANTDSATIPAADSAATT